MYLWFLVTSIHEANTAMVTEAKITEIIATVFADFKPFLRIGLEEQVDPSADTQRRGFSRYELADTVLKNGVTGIGPEKLLYEILREVRLVSEPRTLILPESMFRERSRDCN